MNPSLSLALRTSTPLILKQLYALPHTDPVVVAISQITELGNTTAILEKLTHIAEVGTANESLQGTFRTGTILLSLHIVQDFFVRASRGTISNTALQDFSQYLIQHIETSPGIDEL